MATTAARLITGERNAAKPTTVATATDIPAMIMDIIATSTATTTMSAAIITIDTTATVIVTVAIVTMTAIGDVAIGTMTESSRLLL